MMDEWERGWHGSDKFICPECVGDDYLKAVEGRHCVVDEQECQATDSSGAMWSRCRGRHRT